MTKAVKTTSSWESSMNGSQISREAAWCVCVVLDHKVGSSVCVGVGVWYWITVWETALPRTEFSYKLRRCRARMGFPGGASGKEPACQCKGWKRCGFDPWIGKIPWRRTWQPTSVCLPGESYSQRSLAGYSPWGHRESDRTEATWHTSTHTEAEYEGSWFWAESLYLIVGS